jgi:hypothetical protein
MVMNAPPQGRGGYTGSVEDIRGIHPPPNPLEDKDAAISRVLRMLGVNPGSMSPTAQAIRRQAGALVTELSLKAGQAAASGVPGAADFLASPTASLGALADIVRQGLAGGKIYGGKAGALEGLMKLGQGAEAGTDTSPGAGVVQQLLSSAKNTAELFRQAKYGGLSDQAQGAMASGLLNILDAYSSQLTQNPEAGLGGVGGLMNMLMGRPMEAGGSARQAPTDAMGVPLGGGGAASPGAAATANALGLPPGAAPSVLGLPPGAQGTPSTAQAALPSSLTDPAAAQLMNPPGAMGAYGSNFSGQLFPPALLAALSGGGPPGYETGNMPPGTQYGPAFPGQPQQAVGPDTSFQPFGAQSWLPEPFNTLYRVQQGFNR